MVQTKMCVCKEREYSTDKAKGVKTSEIGEGFYFCLCSFSKFQII